jgi:hypothetical protein
MAYDEQREWPRVRGNPVACFQAPGILERSDRALCGPLRLGTSPGVGPAGALFRDGFGSDLGTDRVTPRGFDPMGTSLERAPRQEASELISRQVRRYNRRNREE